MSATHPKTDLRAVGPALCGYEKRPIQHEPQRLFHLSLPKVPPTPLTTPLTTPFTKPLVFPPVELLATTPTGALPLALPPTPPPPAEPADAPPAEPADAPPALTLPLAPRTKVSLAFMPLDFVSEPTPSAPEPFFSLEACAEFASV